MRVQGELLSQAIMDCVPGDLEDAGHFFMVCPFLSDLK